MSRVLAVLVLVVAAYAGVVTWMLRHEQCRARDVARVAQEASLASAGAVVAKPATSAELKEAARPVENQIERAVAACPVARPVEVVTWRTDPVPVPCPPAPSPPTDATAPAKPPEFEIELRGTDARLETNDGAVAAVGEVEVWTSSASGALGAPALIASRPWRADLSRLLRLEEPKPPNAVRWAVGPVAGRSSEGAVFGGAVMSPAVHVGRHEVMFWVAGVVGRESMTIGGVLARW